MAGEKTTPDAFLKDVQVMVVNTVTQLLDQKFGQQQAQQQAQPPGEIPSQHVQAQKAPVYAEHIVMRRDDAGNLIQVRASVPQLLAELNDNMLDLISVVDERRTSSEKRRRKKG